MNQVTVLLQNGIKEIMSTFDQMQRESVDIFDAYWDTDANVNITALGADSSPATVETKFTKKNYIDGITFSENMNKFFTDDTVTTADYLKTINECKYGNAVLTTQLSEATEKIGTRIKQLCLEALAVYKKCKDMEELYFDNEVGDCVAVWDSQRIVYGSEMTANDLSLAITAIQQYKNLIENAAVTKNDYSSVIAKWERMAYI